MRAQELRQAVADCRARGLYAATKWAAAALCGLPEEEVMGASEEVLAAAAGVSAAFDLARSLFDIKVRLRLGSVHAAAACCAFCNASLGCCRKHLPLCGAQPSRHTSLRLPTTGSRPHFPMLSDAPPLLQEYRSVVHMLAGATDPQSLFLRCYATYLAGEKRKE